MAHRVRVKRSKRSQPEGAVTTDSTSATVPEASRPKDRWAVVTYPVIDEQGPTEFVVPGSPPEFPQIYRPFFTIINSFQAPLETARAIVDEASKSVSEDAVFTANGQPEKIYENREIWLVDDPRMVLIGIYLALEKSLSTRELDFTASDYEPEVKPKIVVAGPGVLRPKQDLWVNGLDLIDHYKTTGQLSYFSRKLLPFGSVDET